MEHEKVSKGCILPDGLVKLLSAESNSIQATILGEMDLSHVSTKQKGGKEHVSGLHHQMKHEKDSPAVLALGAPPRPLSAMLTLAICEAGILSQSSIAASKGEKCSF